jgi:hypothetical protein
MHTRLGWGLDCTIFLYLSYIVYAPLRFCRYSRMHHGRRDYNVTDCIFGLQMKAREYLELEERLAVYEKKCFS